MSLRYFSLAMLSLCAVQAHAAEIFSQNFTGGVSSWQTASGGTMTTADLTAPVTSTSSALAPLITKIGNDTDVRSSTFMAWVKLPVANAVDLFTVNSVGAGSVDGHAGYRFGVTNAGAFSIVKTDNATGTLATLEQGVWTHLAVSMTKNADRTVSTLVFIDGTPWDGLAAPADLIFGSNLNGNGFSQLTIGSGVSIGGLSIHDTALTAGEVSAAYIATSAIPEPSTYGLMGAGALGAVALVRRRRRAK